MALLGSAAIAMWWDIAPAQRVEFEDWHSHEHFPERLSIPGFLRGSRWSNANEGFFVMYELETYDTLTSPHYLKRLNNPTPWSTKMMPHHRNMVRSQCRVLDSYGGGIAGSLLTMRMSPEASQADATRCALLEVLRQDYIRTARVKGLAGTTVIMRHALRNALIPVISLFGLQVAVILSGSVILESIFGLPLTAIAVVNSTGRPE